MIYLEDKRDMTSIFIWKADTPLTGCSMVRYDRGTDWCLEENGESYQLIRQEKGRGEDLGGAYLYYAAKRMPLDWMGSPLLESVIVPYRIWKEEEGVRWDQLGNWYRYVGPETGRTPETQWTEVQRWCRGECSAPVPAPVPVLKMVSDLAGPVRGRGMERVRYPTDGQEGVTGRGRGGRGRGRGGSGRGGRGRGGRGRGNIRI